MVPGTGLFQFIIIFMSAVLFTETGSVITATGFTVTDYTSHLVTIAYSSWLSDCYTMQDLYKFVWCMHLMPDDSGTTVVISSSYTGESKPSTTSGTTVESSKTITGESKPVVTSRSTSSKSGKAGRTEVNALTGDVTLYSESGEKMGVVTQEQFKATDAQALAQTVEGSKISIRTSSSGASGGSTGGVESPSQPSPTVIKIHRTEAAGPITPSQDASAEEIAAYNAAAYTAGYINTQYEGQEVVRISKTDGSYLVETNPNIAAPKSLQDTLRDMLYGSAGSSYTVTEVGGKFILSPATHEAPEVAPKAGLIEYSRKEFDFSKNRYTYYDSEGKVVATQTLEPPKPKTGEVGSRQFDFSTGTMSYFSPEGQVLGTERLKPAKELTPDDIIITTPVPYKKPSAEEALVRQARQENIFRDVPILGEAFTTGIAGMKMTQYELGKFTGQTWQYGTDYSATKISMQEPLALQAPIYLGSGAVTAWMVGYGIGSGAALGYTAVSAGPALSTAAVNIGSAYGRQIVTGMGYQAAFKTAIPAYQLASGEISRERTSGELYQKVDITADYSGSDIGVALHRANYGEIFTPENIGKLALFAPAAGQLGITTTTSMAAGGSSAFVSQVAGGAVSGGAFGMALGATEKGDIKPIPTYTAIGAGIGATMAGANWYLETKGIKPVAESTKVKIVDPEGNVRTYRSGWKLGWETSPKGGEPPTFKGVAYASKTIPLQQGEVVQPVGVYEAYRYTPALVTKASGSRYSVYSAENKAYFDEKIEVDPNRYKANIRTVMGGHTENILAADVKYGATGGGSTVEKALTGFRNTPTGGRGFTTTSDIDRTFVNKQVSDVYGWAKEAGAYKVVPSPTPLTEPGYAQSASKYTAYFKGGKTADITLMSPTPFDAPAATPLGQYMKTYTFTKLPEGQIVYSPQQQIASKFMTIGTDITGQITTIEPSKGKYIQDINVILQAVGGKPIPTPTQHGPMTWSTTIPIVSQITPGKGGLADAEKSAYVFQVSQMPIPASAEEVPISFIPVSQPLNLQPRQPAVSSHLTETPAEIVPSIRVSGRPRVVELSRQPPSKVPSPSTYPSAPSSWSLSLSDSSISGPSSPPSGPSITPSPSPSSPSSYYYSYYSSSVSSPPSPSSVSASYSFKAPGLLGGLGTLPAPVPGEGESGRTRSRRVKTPGEVRDLLASAAEESKLAPKTVPKPSSKRKFLDLKNIFKL